MKILVESFIETESGPVLAHDIALGLMNNGADVCCAVSGNAENLGDWIRDFGYERLFIWDGTPSKKKPLNIVRNSVRIRKFFKGKDFDYLLLTNPCRSDLWASKFIPYRENIMILHDAVPHSSTEPGLIRYTDAVISKADNILVMSKIFVDTALARYGKDENSVFCMRHGIMRYPAYNGSHDSKYLEAKVNFLYFGRIDGYKGLHVLAEAYENVSRRFSGVTLTVAGGGDFSEYSEEFSRLENTRIINRYIEDREIAELFTRPKTVLVLPYLDATQSGVIGIAYNYLTPVIASDTGGIREQLFDGSVGILTQAGNAADLESCMAGFITDKSLYDTQRAFMKDTREKMTWEHITKEFLDRLEKHRHT